MNTRKMFVLVFCCVFMFSVAPASAAIFWDGAGNPTTTSGFDEYNTNSTTGGTPTNEFCTFDSPVAGQMTADTMGLDKWFNFRPSTAVGLVEMDTVNGYFAEVRVNVLQKEAPGGVRVNLFDAKAQTILELNGTGAQLKDGAGTLLLDGTGYGAGFHTVRVERNGASNNYMQLWVDGVSIGSTLRNDSPSTGRFEFGDTNTGADGEAVWDYVGLNATVPEPSSIVLLTSLLMGLIAYAWRKRQ